jgi:hypothetical protein
MRRYLDILRALEARERNPQSCGRGAPNDGRTNEINEKRGAPIHLGMQVRWSREARGHVVLVSESGWVVVQCDPVDLVFLRVDELVRIERGSASC